MEDGLLLYGGAAPELPLRVEGIADFVSTTLFGMKYSDVYRDEFEDSSDRFDYQEDFATYLMDDEAACEHLKKYGLDFTDAAGRPLRCTRFLKLQAEAAAKGFDGHMPDRNAISLGKIQSSLEAEAAAFRARKAAR
ncbi:MAG: hypothetical protein BGN87_18380 [Rhizobiales bacterium 65-79]|nr:MAG: hypothetical protein BGN87_18380 [Rhizobiales bacterium 65-79]